MINDASTGTHPAPKRRSSTGQRHWLAGREFVTQRRWRDAAQSFERAARASPADSLYWLNLANAQRNAGVPDRAEAAARRTLELSPDDPLALQVLGECLAQMHRYAESVEVFARLGACGEPDASTLVRQASMLLALQRPKEAIAVLLKALSANPGLLQGHALLADAFRDLAMRQEAVECMKTVLALDPHNLEAMSHLSFANRHLCDWSQLDTDLQRIEEELRRVPAHTPRVAACFALLSLPVDPMLQLQAASGESAAVASSVELLPPLKAAERRHRARRRPRLGWVSYDFREHPVSQLAVELLEQIDRSQFEVLLYSAGPDDRSPLRQRVVAAADRFVDIRGLSDRQAAQLMRDDGVDLLIDLNGHTRGHRLGVCAARPAPVQISYLGFPASTGAAFIDYLVGDPLITPMELAHQSSEKLALMPLTWQPNGRWRPLPQPMSRAEAGLPEDAFVMCGFNHSYKILPAALDAWCTVMSEVPRAVLWLKGPDPQLQDNVRREVKARGVAPERVIFAQTIPYEDHFSRLALADVFVDTWPYNAQTTAADALWAGLPVVTHYGNGFSSRVAASVLNAAGLGELAFETVEDYTLAILALAQNPGLLDNYKRHLAEGRLTLPLFDTARYAREFESLLQRMWRRWLDGLPPEHLLAN